MRDFFLAADGLQREGEDREGTRLVADTVEDLDPQTPPFGVSAEAWQQVVTAGEALADALVAGGGDPDVVSERARQLRSLLRPLV